MKCPICKVELPKEGGAHRPFCSRRCQLIDLGNWLGERYVVPGQEPASENSDAGAREAASGPQDAQRP